MLRLTRRSSLTYGLIALCCFFAPSMARESRTEAITTIAFKNRLCIPATPRVSIITSLYKGDLFIEEFLKDITRQTIFNECELLIIDAASPGNEYSIIKKYCELYPNIIYERLEKDPGIYAVWNYAIKKARAPFITNANVDDRKNPMWLERQVRALEQNPDEDLVYSDFLVSYVENAPFEACLRCDRVTQVEFTPENLCECLPGPNPMWRRDVHDRFGWFDERFISAGDWEFWNRIVKQGARFKKLHGIGGVYYLNPAGLSTDQDPVKLAHRIEENNLVRRMYGHLWVRK